MSKKKEGKNGGLIVIGAIVFGVIVGAVVLLTWFLTYKDESYTSPSAVQDNYATLECVSSDLVESFFAHSDARNYTHDIRVMFIGDRMREMSYRYDGIFDSNKIAESVSAQMHANYNKYMGSSNVDHEILSPVFAVDGNGLTITLLAEGEKINRTVASLFLIDKEEFGEMGSYAIGDFERMYESKGFACKIQD